MRKNQYAEILTLLQTLREAHTELRKQSARGATVNLLADCQDFALRVGQYIEEIEGEGTETVALLIEYYKLVYQASAAGGGADQAGRLEDQLAKIENAVRSELRPNKLEIVFFPYKYAMADSLRSIWEAALADPQCDVYICPIPYYERQPSGAFGPMRCEADLFPRDLPLVDWREYDAAARRPDIIYIHNPYDENNYVTSVHPAFYSARLKRCTDLLVYSPYFVSYDDSIPEQYALTAGVVNAAKVVLQSEKLRQNYIRASRLLAREYDLGEQATDWAEKFVALGSPKFDSLLGAGWGGVSIPEDWRRLTTGKKVVLYNTSIGAILSGDQDYLRKLRDVLTVFSRRADLVLLWRPHPLSEAAYRSMRPRLLAAYERIVTDYRRESWGIYDDSPDPRRAVLISDAYYGDLSSLVALYAVTGKPMMLQNRFIRSDSAWDAIMFNDLYDDGQYFWFTPIDFNALFRMDKQTWQAEYRGSIPLEHGDGAYLFGAITQCEGKLYLPPGTARRLGEYDIKTGAIRAVDLGLDESKKYSIKFADSVVYGSSLFLIGCAYPAIVEYDTRTGKTHQYDDWLKPLAHMDANTHSAYFAYGRAVKNEIIIGTCRAGAVLVFNMDDGNSKIFQTDAHKDGFYDVCWDGDKYWFAPLADPSCVISWDKETREYTEYANFPPGFAADPYARICRAGGFIWFFPLNSNMTLRIDPCSGKTETAAPFMRECERGEDEPRSYSLNYLFAAAMDGVVYAHTGKSNTFISYDTETGLRRETPILLSAEDREKCMDYCLRSRRDQDLPVSIGDCAFRENTVFHLTDFLDRLLGGSPEIKGDIRAAQLRICRDNIVHADGTAGAAIHAEMKRLVLAGAEMSS
ncbi:MAG: WD40 repeat domain-containing protein [Gracilibacteraceae bacterium]|jgi:hypothetical protein|nr:WD40 repeat domain-containing protein [Gracilibacteraceae bacterium]